MGLLIKTIILCNVLMSCVLASELGEKKNVTKALDNEIQMLEARLDSVVKTIADTTDLTLAIRQLREYYYEQEMVDLTASLCSIGQDQSLTLEIANDQNSPLKKAEKSIEEIRRFINDPKVYQDHYKQIKVKEAYAILKQIHHRKTMIHLAQFKRKVVRM